MIDARRAAMALLVPLVLFAAESDAGARSLQRREMPDTTSGIHVFNDQTNAHTVELVEFTALRYAGTQKQTRAQADALRALDPDFIVLHYRFGMGLGERATPGNCVPKGGG